MKRQVQTFYYAISAFLVCWQGLIPNQLADPDLWGRLSIAALWFKNGYFPYRDVFSFTAFHHRWIDHEWLSGMLFYAALRWGGELGLHALKYGIILALFYLIFSNGVFSANDVPSNGQSRAFGRKFLPVLLFACLLILLPVYGDALYPTIRSQLFSFLFFACFLRILEQARQEQGATPSVNLRLWLLAPIGVFWANAHGGFILGLILLALYGLGAALQHKNIRAALPYWLILGILALLIAVLNPYGFSYWPFILHALTMPRPFISEWNPLPLLSMDYWETKLLMLSTLLAFIIPCCWPAKTALAQAQKRPLITPALVLCFLIGLAIKGVRFKAFLAFGALFYIPAIVTAWPAPQPIAQPQPGKKTGNLLNVLPGLSGAAALALILWCYPSYYYGRTVVQTGDFASAHGLIPFPVSMMEYLKNSPYQGKLINPFGWGEFLAWNLYPRFKVAWDGRYEEVYPQPVMDFYTEFYALPHRDNPTRLNTMANHSAADFILIERISPNQHIMAQNPDWQILNSDGFYFLYGRRSSLKRLPPYHAKLISQQQRQPDRLYTIGDFFRPEELNRFQSP